MSDRTAAILDDMELLREYARTGSEAAFSLLVNRHIDWVFSVCHRGLRDRHLAEDVTQAVFLLLARKAKTIPEATILRGWLFKTARFAVSDALKKRARAKKHHERAASMTPTHLNGSQEQTWERVSPLLDEAVACLGAQDRQAVILRFYGGKSLAEVAQAMGTSEEAAKKRVARAVEKLRTLFSRQGVVLPVALLFGLLVVRPTQAAPAQLATKALSIATGQTAASPFIQSIVKGTLESLIRATHRLLAAITAGSVALLIALLSVLFSLVSATPTPQASIPPSLPNPSLPPQEVRIPHADLSQIAHLWIGSGEGILFDYVPGREADNDRPIFSEPQVYRPFYAVVRDRSGQFWSKPLDLTPFVSPGDGYQPAILAPIGPTARHNTAGLLSLLLGDTPPLSQGLSLADPPAPGQAAALPNFQLDHVDSPWTPLSADPASGSGSSSLVSDSPIPGIHIENKSGINPRNFVAVPEPGTLALCLVGASLLTLRRRRTAPIQSQI